MKNQTFSIELTEEQLSFILTVLQTPTYLATANVLSALDEQIKKFKNEVKDSE